MPDDIENISLSSVVPYMDYSLRSACKKYFDIEPFQLHAGLYTGLKINIGDPKELGADRIATSMAALERYPDQNIIIVDFGTATTFCALSAISAYLGGVILPGLRLSMEALSKNAAMLPPVEIMKPRVCVGITTEEHIQSGLYYGHIGAIKEFTKQFTDEVFGDKQPIVIATGGFASLFSKENLFTHIDPDLVLQGLRLAYYKLKGTSKI